MVQGPCGDVVGAEGSADLVTGHPCGELVRVPGGKVGSQSAAGVEILQAVQCVQHLVLSNAVYQLTVAHNPLVGVGTVALEISGQRKIGVHHAGGGTKTGSCLAAVDGGAVLGKLHQHIVDFFHVGGFIQTQRLEPVLTVVQAGNAFGGIQSGRNAIELAVTGRILYGSFAQRAQHGLQIPAAVVFISIGQVTQIVAVHEFIEVFAFQHHDVGNFTGADLQRKTLGQLIVGNHPQEVQLNVQEILRQLNQRVGFRGGAFLHTAVGIPADNNIQLDRFVKGGHPFHAFRQGGIGCGSRERKREHHGDRKDQCKEFHRLFHSGSSF